MTGTRPGTLRVLEPDTDSHLIVSPTEGMMLWFGRNRPEVHICIGADDLGVSRRHGTLEYRAGYWWVRALGARPVGLGCAQQLRRGDDPVPLPGGRTSLQVEGVNPNEVYVVRVEIAGPPTPLPSAPSVQCGRATKGVRTYRLSAPERLVLTVIAQRLLRRDPGARLLTYREAVAELERLQPDVWTPKKVEHLVRKVRDRLKDEGAEGVNPPPDDKVGGDMYRRNLLDILIRTGTLGVDDLRLLDGDDQDGDDQDEREDEGG